VTVVDDSAAASRDSAPAGDEPARPGRLRRWPDVVAVAILAGGLLLPLRGLLVNQGPPMEEGFMLVFPELVLRGELPNRDFLHLYGPGGLWVLAGAFKVFGVSLLVERLVAFMQLAGIVFGVYLVTRRWGRLLGLVSAVISLVIIVPPLGLTALAWNGAVALGLLAIVAALASLDRSEGHVWTVVGGVLFGFALLYRLDLVVAVGLGAVALAYGARRGFARHLATGVALGLSPYLIHLFTAGPSTVVRGMILDPVIYLRGGRRLPIPPPPGHLDGFLQRAGDLRRLAWPLPVPRTATQLTIWFFVLLAAATFVLAVGWWAFRLDRTSTRARALLAVGAFGFGLLPQAVQRVDSAHFAWVSCVPVAVLPVAVAEVLRHRRPAGSARRQALASGAGVAAVVLLLFPNFTFRTYADYSAQTFGYHRNSWKVEHDGRIFFYGRADVARAATRLLARIDAISEPGQKVVVGESDLRRTNYSDAYLYYLLLPKLVPGTYYIEMDPGMANRSGSGLADDVRAADFVILSSVWDDWREPNDSRELGSDEPNRVLEEHFCPVGDFDGFYRLYRRCR